MDRLSKCVLALVTASAIGALTYTEAFAQERVDIPACGQTDQMIAILESDFGEVMIGAAWSDNQTGILIFASADGATFTFLEMGANDRACIMATGVDLDLAPVPSSEERAA